MTYDELVILHGRFATARDRLERILEACATVGDMRAFVGRIEAFADESCTPKLTSSDVIGIVDALRAQAATSGTAICVGGYGTYRDVADIGRDAARLIGEMQVAGDPELREALDRIRDLEGRDAEREKLVESLRDALRERELEAMDRQRVAA